MGNILGCFVVVSLLVARLPGGELSDQLMYKQTNINLSLQKKKGKNTKIQSTKTFKIYISSLLLYFTGQMSKWDHFPIA